MLPEHLVVVVLGVRSSALLPVMIAVAMPILLDAILFHLLPNLTRADIFFAVTVDPGFRQTTQARKIIRQFRRAVWIHSTLAFAVVYAAFSLERPLLGLIGIVWQLAALLFAFLLARKETMPHANVPVRHHEASLVPRSAGGTGFALLQGGPFALLVASAIYIRMIWYRIPERFPVHWGLDGRPNGWATRSFTGIYGFWLIGFTICAFIEIFAYGTLHWTRQIRATGIDAQNEAHFRRVQAGALIALEYFFAVVFNGIPFRAMGPHPEQAPNMGPFLFGTLAFIGVLVAIMIHTGQGGANLARAGTESSILAGVRTAGDRTPDQCWRAGMFYVNPNDPAVLVEKRFGIGYTLNFGRPAAWLLTAVILVLVILPLVIGFVATHSH